MFRTLRKMLALAATAAVSGGPVHAQEVAETVAPPAPEEEAVAVAPPARFDPGQMPEAKPVTPPLGYRHGDLTASEAAALRRSLKLPLDALASASSSYDLTRRAVVAPLPDPHRPLLSVSPAAVSTANPFGDTRSTSFAPIP